MEHVENISSEGAEQACGPHEVINIKQRNRAWNEESEGGLAMSDVSYERQTSLMPAARGDNLFASLMPRTSSMPPYQTLFDALKLACPLRTLQCPKHSSMPS